MKNIFLILCFSALTCTTGWAQKGTTGQNYPILRTTYPVDSCLYFADPFDFRVQSFNIIGGGEIQLTNFRFRSVNNPDQMMMGKGRSVIYRDSLFLRGVTLETGSKGRLLLTVTDLPDDAGNWPGGQPPFPLLLYGFLTKVGNTTVDPPLAITMQVQQLQIENTTE
jgi:hypothetical protein